MTQQDTCGSRCLDQGVTMEIKRPKWQTKEDHPELTCAQAQGGGGHKQARRRARMSKKTPTDWASQMDTTLLQTGASSA